MTNYCQNKLTVDGSREDMAIFAAQCLTPYGQLWQLDFEKITPKPQIIMGLTRKVPSKLGYDYPEGLDAAVVGIEALGRAPVKLLGGVRKLPSILDQPRVKSLGINSYDGLVRWLQQNDPMSLELGRKCLAAFEATGNYFEDDWEVDKWGTDPGRVEYSGADLHETRYDAAFCSPWGSPEGTIRVIASRYPGLTVWFAGLEEGNAYVFRLASKDGAVAEERPPITDAIIEEFEGPGEVASRQEDSRAFWQQPSELIKQPMRHFRHWRSDARLNRALLNYLPYTPPHRAVECLMSAEQSRENFEFFLAEKAGRVDGLRRFLQSFGVRLGFNDLTKDALDKWLADYAGLLFVSETRPSFMTYEPAWTGPRAGLNVIFDIGIFLGDFAIHENPDLRWGTDDATETGGIRFDERFQRTVLVSEARSLYFPRDITDETYRFCHSQCEASYMWARGRFQYGSKALARQFATKTLRRMQLLARGEWEAANRES